MDDQQGPATVLASQADLLSEPVPHVHPLTTEPLTTGPLTDEQLNKQISDTLPELFKHFHELSQRIATEFGMNGSDAIALLKLDAPMTMKELGQRMGCDPSFITTIADALEKHGLARREPSLRDRRSKNIVLTPEGETVRDRLFREILAQAPWCTRLDTGERRCLLGLMRKMLKSRGGR
jgi:DNA-binding MarR family transcriptional regulator